MTAVEHEGERPVQLRTDHHVVVLLGNPNTGKSTLFSALTGVGQKTANFPGVTVEAKVGAFRSDNTEVSIIDLPGSYSLAARSPDERIATEALLGRLDTIPRPDGVLVVVDASNLDRNLYLASQVLEYGLPVVVALTMVDVAASRGIEVDPEALSKALGVPVVGIHAPRGTGIADLRSVLHRTLHHPREGLNLEFPEDFQRGVQTLHERLTDLGVALGYTPSRPEALRLLVDRSGPFFDEVRLAGGATFVEELDRIRERAATGGTLSMLEAQTRYRAIGQWTSGARRIESREGQVTRTDRIDAVLTHRVWGTLVFVLVMGLVFQSIYAWAGPLMDAVESAIGAIGDVVSARMAEGPLRSLIVDGLIGGVGGILVFLPQILILFFFIALLEDLGYMARAAFLMDRLMARFGLSGRSFIPLLSSFACSIPGIMGARVIEDRNTRLTTIFLAPFMSCSARLPVYTIMIAAFVPARTLPGGIELQGVVLFAMYFVGVAAAIPTALVLKRGILRSSATPFLLELPSYKVPRLANVGRVLWSRGGSFVRRAGTIILATSIVVWALGYFPRDEGVLARYEALRADRVEALAAEEAAIVAAFDPALAPEAVAEDARLGPAVAAWRERRTAHDEAIAALEEDLADDEAALAGAVDEAEATLATDQADHDEAHGPAALPARALVEAARTAEADRRAIDDGEAGALLRESYLGRMGRAIEPAVRPLGWDWRIGMAAIASLPAREVIIATLGTIFNLGAETDETSEPLKQVLLDARHEGDDRPLFTLATALSIMVFFALCAQCAATLAVMRRETNSWRWPIASFVYMTSLAYVASLVTYQVAHWLGG